MTIDTNSHDIGWAVEQMRQGYSVQRAGWNGKDAYIYLSTEVLKNFNFEPFIIMHTQQGRMQPGWLCSQADLLATDWQLTHHAYP